MREALRKQIRRFLFRLLLIHGALLMVLAAIFIVSDRMRKEELASVYTALARKDIAIGDFRQAILSLGEAVEKNFITVAYFDNYGEKVFVLPPTIRNTKEDIFPKESSFFKSVLTKNLYSDQNNQHHLGSLYFAYYRFGMIPSAVGAWIFFLLLSLPAVFWSKKKLIQDYEKSLQHSVDTMLADQAGRLIHDIRGPLMVLHSVISALAELPDDLRTKLRTYVGRISDIVDALKKERELLKNGQSDGRKSSLISAQKLDSAPLLIQERSIEHICEIVDQLVLEKRIQYAGHKKIAIKKAIKEENLGLFAKVHRGELQRMLSNLIDNAVQAVGERGEIQVLMRQKDDWTLIAVGDDGKGIAPEEVPFVCQKGISFRNPPGEGLGLYHAKKAVEAWGGQLSIDSKLGAGTTVTLSLPRSMPPSWFISEIQVRAGSTVAILDDDDWIHQIWKAQFKKAFELNDCVMLKHFYHSDDLIQWRMELQKRSQIDFKQEVLYLLDYQLSPKDPRNGIAVAEALGVCQQAILVTSSADDKNIQDACGDLSLKLLSKSKVIGCEVPLTKRSETRSAVI